MGLLHETVPAKASNTSQTYSGTQLMSFRYTLSYSISVLNLALQRWAWITLTTINNLPGGSTLQCKRASTSPNLLVGMISTSSLHHGSRTPIKD